ncbi:hypothetical protein PtoMrB4_52530 [Metapseudomonas otitidis]|uniref:Uncharacterized protein n=1 Tax=Metapseudomonas otitidis TaxID=319939 RepID=A0A679GIV0_9GAMM|nr:hypothetical protein PtoMrB4_52530 [Pseudomonas otitidis]
MQVGHARQHRPMEPLGALGTGIGEDLFKQAGSPDLEADITCPARGQEGSFSVEGRHGAGSR